MHGMSSEVIQALQFLYRCSSACVRVNEEFHKIFLSNQTKHRVISGALANFRESSPRLGYRATIGGNDWSHSPTTPARPLEHVAGRGSSSSARLRSAGGGATRNIISPTQLNV
ncbi:hypothetical protein EVAR_93352_1 [Eumeta japonica]|uniref:Uncharacterized protein n=1 Tax=Eumeta variegata TaxID=151549 RepID=A0A4C1USY7_EUMVA|nr:hypothetical protein EVAR_93352_1 [Eumeta japonica]